MSLALVLSGGGGKGRYQAGVVEWMAENRAAVEARLGVACCFKTIAGTSVGALAAVACAMAGSDPATQLDRFSRLLQKRWEELDGTSSVWRWRQPMLLAGLYNPSVGDTSPLQSMLMRAVDYDAVMDGPTCIVSAWNLLDGTTERWDLRTAQNKKELVDMLMASCCFPVAFPPVEVRGGYYIDGGVTEITPVKPVIDRGATKVLAIVCRDPHSQPPKRKSDFGNVLAVLSRYNDGSQAESSLNDLERIDQVNAVVRAGGGAGKRIIECLTIVPHEPLGDPLDFSKELAAHRHRVGREAARRAFLG